MTLLAIQKSASEEVIPIRGRAVRDVTVPRIHEYAILLEKWGLCSAAIPPINQTGRGSGSGCAAAVAAEGDKKGRKRKRSDEGED